jgi:predicted protein tyrosine phosphatase
MDKIIDQLYVGDDNDDSHAAAKGFSILVCAKDGPHGHRHMLGYTTPGAPKDKNYYFVQKGNRMALNLIDSDNPNMIPEQAIQAGLDFIQEQVDEGKNVLVHCNAGHSRGPTTALMFLRSIGEMPGSFHQSETKFKTLYPKFDPNQGMEQFARFNWRNLLGGKVENVN